LKVGITVYPGALNRVPNPFKILSPRGPTQNKPAIDHLETFLTDLYVLARFSWVLKSCDCILLDSVAKTQQPAFKRENRETLKKETPNPCRINLNPQHFRISRFFTGNFLGSQPQGVSLRNQIAIEQGIPGAFPIETKLVS
jgi:hypothetical protein